MKCSRSLRPLQNPSRPAKPPIPKMCIRDSLHIVHGVALQAVHLEDIIGQHLHTQGLGHTAQSLANAAVADHAQGLAADLNALSLIHI